MQRWSKDLRSFPGLFSQAPLRSTPHCEAPLSPVPLRSDFFHNSVWKIHRFRSNPSTKDNVLHSVFLPEVHARSARLPPARCHLRQEAPLIEAAFQSVAQADFFLPRSMDLLCPPLRHYIPLYKSHHRSAVPVDRSDTALPLQKVQAVSVPWQSARPPPGCRSENCVPPAGHGTDWSIPSDGWRLYLLHQFPCGAAWQDLLPKSGLPARQIPAPFLY